MEVLLAKFSNHFVAKYQDVGKANKEAMRIQTGYSLIRRRTIVLTSAPMAFRIPISLVRLTDVKRINPNSPITEIRMARMVK